MLIITLIQFINRVDHVNGHIIVPLKLHTKEHGTYVNEGLILYVELFHCVFKTHITTLLYPLVVWF